MQLVNGLSNFVLPVQGTDTSNVDASTFEELRKQIAAAEAALGLTPEDGTADTAVNLTTTDTVGIGGTGQAGLATASQARIGVVIPTTTTTTTAVPAATTPVATTTATASTTASASASASASATATDDAAADPVSDADQQTLLAYAQDQKLYSTDLKSTKALSAGDAQTEAALKILSNPSKASAAQVQAAQNYVNASPALQAAITSRAGSSTDGSISSKGAASLLKDYQSDQTQQIKALRGYMAKNKNNVSEDSLREVLSAAEIGGNTTLIAAADPDGSKGKYATQAGLESIAENNAGLGAALQQSAQAWSSQGMFNQLDTGGKNQATNQDDGLMEARNAAGWIAKQASATQEGTDANLQTAAFESLTPDVDISQLDGDIFKNPQNYTGEQKTAVLIKLTETLADVQSGASQGLGKTKQAISDLEGAINTLSNDSDVQAYAQQKLPTSISSIGDSLGIDTSAILGASGLAAVVLGASSAGNTQIRPRISTGEEGANGSRAATAAEQGAARAGTVASTEAGVSAGETAGVAAGETAGVAAGETAGVAAGETAGVVAGEAAAGGLSLGLAAGGVGLVVGGVAAGIMAIVHAVKKHNDTKAFDANVNGTLSQFGLSTV